MFYYSIKCRRVNSFSINRRIYQLSSSTNCLFYEMSYSINCLPVNCRKPLRGGGGGNRKISVSFIFKLHVYNMSMFLSHDTKVLRCLLHRYIRPCQSGILLSVNSSLTNLGTYSQKHTNRKRKHNYLTTKTMHYIHVNI